MKRFLMGFVFAWRGIGAAVAEGLNLKVMLVVSVAVIGLGLTRDLSPVRWSILVVCMALVLSLEIFNTALERLVDRLSPEHDARYGQVKDMAAGAVLVSAVGAAIAGVLVLFF